MQELLDILSFKTMISKQMLFLFYYLGAILVPIITYKYAKYIYKPLKNKAPKTFFIFIALFIFMEILWRMMFEFLIAFLQIRDALV